MATKPLAMRSVELEPRVFRRQNSALTLAFAPGSATPERAGPRNARPSPMREKHRCCISFNPRAR
jgi:hypothetical protein